MDTNICATYYYTINYYSNQVPSLLWKDTSHLWEKLFKLPFLTFRLPLIKIDFFVILL